MTTISIVYGKTGAICGFDISGHAGYNDAGSDIVCAAISALSQTTLLGLLKYTPDDTTYTVDEESGSLTVRVSKGSVITEALLETLTLGLKEIARQYPTYVVLHS
mgnify:CR=1 FL=1